MIPLDSARWSELHDATGSASTVAELLRSIEAGLADDTAWSDLWSRIFHQGEVYEAPSQPFLT